MATRYCVAVQLLDRAVLPAQFNTSHLNRDQLWNLVDKVSCECDPSFDQSKRWTTRLSVHFECGTCLEEEDEGPRTTHMPLRNHEVVEKWRGLAASCIDDARRDEIEKLVLNIEKVEDVRDLTRVLGDKTRCSIS